MKEFFNFDSRLGISIPSFKVGWDELSLGIQHQILLHWEKIRGHIPDRIAELESLINQKQAELNDESNFTRSCKLNSEIAELASIINDLWLWYRTHQDVTSEKAHLG
ncbi:ABC transporter C-terminal domain-containing protein [Bacillus sp. B15-48]|uniref:ABC transporter C-terminal domain-containing protein n=1 Tax=Bacillus sp. B15-48 TaxID=1548601 RepID=UPI00193FD76E|nr:ABC transporter C-terminal domain-containing protein [Bacillus sp. B15-48]MBM4762557.1 hypothetical protein [Bacillus sp. B15-48]